MIEGQILANENQNNRFQHKKIVKFSKYNIVIAKLYNLILNLNEAEQLALLKKAQELYTEEKRIHERKTCRIPVKYTAYDCIYSDCITNISQNGLFIETKRPLIVSDEIIMIFALEGLNETLKIRGKIVHANRMGVGVEFKNISSHLAEMIGVVIKRMKN